MKVDILMAFDQPPALAWFQLSHVSKHEWLFRVVVEHTFKGLRETLFLFPIQRAEFDMDYEWPAIINRIFKSGKDSLILRVDHILRRLIAFLRVIQKNFRDSRVLSARNLCSQYLVVLGRPSVIGFPPWFSRLA